MYIYYRVNLINKGSRNSGLSDLETKWNNRPIAHFLFEIICFYRSNFPLKAGKKVIFHAKFNESNIIFFIICEKNKCWNNL